MFDQAVLSPSQFVEGFNMLVEYNLPTVVIEGELSEFRISKNRWLYLNIVDEVSSVACFGTVYMLKNQLEDGMVVRIQAAPRLHKKFGFSLNLISIMPVGEGSILRSAQLLKVKLETEGIFAPERKRALPFAPQAVGLITSESSAAYHDFIKVLNQQWTGVNILFSDTLVQGEGAPSSLIKAIELQNQLLNSPEVLVITRGGGSAEDLAAFNDELLVRAIAASRIPTMVAVGHEVDITLAELAADRRASTPSGAASDLFPDKRHESHKLKVTLRNLDGSLDSKINAAKSELLSARSTLNEKIKHLFAAEQVKLKHYHSVVEALNPANVLKRGYSVLKINSKTVKSANSVRVGQNVKNTLLDGTISSKVTKVEFKEGLSG